MFVQPIFCLAPRFRTVKLSEIKVLRKDDFIDGKSACHHNILRSVSSCTISNVVPKACVSTCSDMPPQTPGMRAEHYLVKSRKLHSALHGATTFLGESYREHPQFILKKLRDLLEVSSWFSRRQTFTFTYWTPSLTSPSSFT